ncbi:MAG: restriction endonuclease subunit S [Bacteroidales bacterium]|nr:restriction endonuclease subunit S [Bacteroidales bacterium]
MKQNWQIKKLKDICEKGSSNVNMKDLTDLQGEYPIYGASGLIKNVNFYHQEKEYIGIIKDGSGIGRTMLLPPKSSVIGTLQYILPKEGNLIQFINYALQSLDLTKFKQGAAIPHIYFKDYGETEIVVPPLAEQRRIVAILDAKFVQIDALKVAAQKNLDNAEQLWKAQLEKEFGNKEWKMMKFGECGSFKNGMNFNSTDTGYSIHSLGVGDFKNHFQINDTSTLPIISLKSAPNEDYLLQNEDIVFVRSNGNKELVGRCVITYPNDIKTTYSGFCIRFRNNYKGLNVNFLTHYLKTETIRKKIRGNNGTNISNLNQKILSNLEIPIPSLAEQTAIVSRLDALSAKISDLKAKYRRQIECCDELRQSLLREAFEGEM